MNKISIDYKKLLASKARKVLARRLIVTSAITLNLLPLVTKDFLNSNAKLALAISGLVTGLCCLKLPDYEYEQKLIDTYEKTSLKEYKLVLQGEILKTQTKLEITNQQDLAATIEHLPEHQIDYFAQKYGVVPILSKYYIAEETEQKPEVIEPATIPLKNIFLATIERAESESGIVFNWMRKALNQSCFLAGKKRSGKTYFMKWLLAGYIEQCTDKDTFFISDPHYDNVDFDDPWINPEADKKLLDAGRLVKTEADTLKMLSSVLGAFEIRKRQGLTTKKGVGKVRVFMDEVDSYSPEIQEEISQFIKTIEYEAAKYGFTVCVGVHSIKKGEMGIDSSVIASMLQILFAGIVLDSNSVLSGAFPGMPARKTAINKYKAEHNTNRIVYIGDDTDVFVSHIPDLVLPNYVDSSENEEEVRTAESAENGEKPGIEAVLNQLVIWCKSCYEKFGKYPTVEHIKIAWKDLTGKDLDEKGTTLLREYLYKLGIEI